MKTPMIKMITNTMIMINMPNIPRNPTLVLMSPGSQNYRYNYKDNPEDDPRYRAIPEDALVVVLPFMKKAKCDTNNEIQ